MAGDRTVVFITGEGQNIFVRILEGGEELGVSPGSLITFGDFLRKVDREIDERGMGSSEMAPVYIQVGRHIWYAWVDDRGKIVRGPKVLELKHYYGRGYPVVFYIVVWKDPDARTTLRFHEYNKAFVCHLCGKEWTWPEEGQKRHDTCPECLLKLQVR